MNYETLKNIVLEILDDKELWVNEIHRRVILHGFKVSVPTVSKTIKKLEKEGLVETKIIGKTLLVRRKKRW